MFVGRESVPSEFKTDRAETMRGSLGCLLLYQISLELDQHQRAEVIKSNGLSPLKPAIAIVTPAIGLEERAIPEANWSGEIMNAAFKPTLAAISGIIGAKLKKAALPEPITKAEPTTMRNITVKTA